MPGAFSWGDGLGDDSIHLTHRAQKGSGAPPQSYTRARKFTTKQILPDDSTVAFACGWSNALLGARLNLELKVSEEAHTAQCGSALANLQVLVRGILRADVAVARPAELVLVSGILAEPGS